MVDESTLEKLEFDTIREVLAQCCATPLGGRLARSLRPSINDQAIRRWLQQVRELSVLAATDSLPPLAGIHDIRDYVRASAFPAPLEPDALARVAGTLSATGPLCAWFTRVADSVPSLEKLRWQIQDLTPIADAIDESIDSRGQVRDSASERLASIRSAVEQAREQIRKVFDRMLRQSSLTRMLQYAGSTFHNDRMVLPLKVEYRGRIPGIIHRSSDTGATLFVEPTESVELNNTIVGLRDEESKEITRILRLLSQKVAVNADPILLTLRAIGVLDLIAAKCRYAIKRKCICPEVDESGILELHDARHPVLIEVFDRRPAEPMREGPIPAHSEARFGQSSELTSDPKLDPVAKPEPREPPVNVRTRSDRGAAESLKREVVPIDIRLGDDFDVLVITGPNTGGKTVCLKTVGLLAVMAQCGIPIPAAEGSRLPVYRRIFIDIGDEQSLQQSLSTFSSHLANHIQVLRHSGPRSLVLIDELGAGTDPDEGAAIGRAILGELLKLRAKTIVTTHLSALKAVAFTTDRVDNACVEFDPESLRPTYRLRLGEPGNSMALIIACRLGMPGRLIKAAEGYLDNTTRALNKAIAGTLQSRRQAEEARRAAKDAALQADRERQELEKKLQELQHRRRDFERWTEWINTLKRGDEVFIKSLRRPGRVVRMELHRQRALVSAGGVDIELPLRDVAPNAEV